MKATDRATAKNHYLKVRYVYKTANGNMMVKINDGRSVRPEYVITHTERDMDTLITFQEALVRLRTSPSGTRIDVIYVGG